MDKYFICLANSYKRNGRCIAGVEVTISHNDHWKIVRNDDGSPHWIRPIDRHTEYGEILEGEARYIPLLSVVKLSEVEPCPHESHSEDVNYMQMTAIGMIHNNPDVLEQLSDNGVTILRNRGFKYFDSTDMTGLQVYNHALKELMAYCKTDDMIILDNKSLVKGNLLAFVDQSYRTVKDKNASIVYLNMKRIRKERLEAFEKDTDEMYKNFFTDSCMEKTSVNQLVTVDHIMSDAKFIEWIMHNKHLSPSAKRIPSSSARRRAAPYAPPSRLSNTG